VRPRIVSLVPSATETLLALGADVVGCTRFCKQPTLPAYGGTKNPDVAAIVAARPDAVVVDVEENRREDADALAAAGLRVVVTDVTSLGSCATAVDQLADAAGVPRPPAIDVGAAVERARLAFVPIWRRPWMTINRRTYGASLLASIGWGIVTGERDDTYPVVELSDPSLRPVDAVLVPSEPYSFTDEHLDELQASFPDAAVIRVDGEDLFWWGSRTPAARRRLEHQILSASHSRFRD